jgi:GNAT superfamily N-acetyltransferase
MPTLTDTDLYRRGADTLVASWEQYARASGGAAVLRSPGVAAAVFPAEPERGVYNNALLDRGLDAADRTAALDAMEAAYASRGVPHFAAWVHESDEAMRADLAARGYAVSESTRAMGMALGDIRVARPDLDLAPPSWAEYVRISGLPPDLLRELDPAAFHVLVARLDGEGVAAAMGRDHGDDLGVHGVLTRAPARRRGLGTALTARLAHDAAARGCRTATLQATEIGERVYAAVGFLDLGRFLEFVP